MTSTGHTSLQTPRRAWSAPPASSPPPADPPSAHPGDARAAAASRHLAATTTSYHHQPAHSKQGSSSLLRLRTQLQTQGMCYMQQRQQAIKFEVADNTTSWVASGCRRGTSARPTLMPRLPATPNEMLRSSSALPADPLHVPCQLREPRRAIEVRFKVQNLGPVLGLGFSFPCE